MTAKVTWCKHLLTTILWLEMTGLWVFESKGKYAYDLIGESIIWFLLCGRGEGVFHTDSGAFSVYIVKRHWCDVRYYEDQNLRDRLARSLDFELRQIATWFWQNPKITCVGFSVPVTATLWTIVFFPLHVVTKCPTWWTYFSAHWKKGQSGYCNGPLQIHIYDPIPTLVSHTLKGMVKNELQ